MRKTPEMKIKNHIYTAIFLLITVQVIAQDAYFSQFYNAPTMFNSAEIGYRSTGGKYRLNGTHRNFGEGFQTTSLAFDGTIDWRDKSFMGLGGTLIQDKSPGGGFNTLTLLGGFGLHLSLDDKEKHYLSIGTQLGMVNSQLRTENLKFENDILGGESEVFVNTNVFNMDTRAGAIYSFFPSDHVQMKFAIGMNHLRSFTNEFISAYSETKTQFSLYFDYNQQIDKWNLNPHIIHMRQGTFNQTLIGFTGTRYFENDKGFSAGASYRSAKIFSFNNMSSDNSVIFIAGISMSTGTRFYASYDQSISRLNNLSSGVGNIEFGVQYIINSAKSKRSVSPDMLRNQGN
jgi:type IX secretion system PorP/SprF family membrane protein